MVHVGLIVKGTRLCNLRCTYCHDWSAAPDQTMGFPVLAAMTHAALRDPEHTSVEFIWHGGETTLLPIKFYQKAVLLQQRLRRRDQRVTNSIQTNATRITDDWARFFKDYDFSVGVSIDAMPEIHDRDRRYVSGRKSFSDVIDGIAVLRAHGVAFGALMVVDQETINIGPDRVFDAFLDLGIKNYGLLAAKPVNQPDATAPAHAEHYVDPRTMNTFLIALYDRWRSHGDKGILIRELNGIERRLRNAAPHHCTLEGDCFGRYFMVEPNGDVAHCDVFVGDPRYTLGNVLRESFSQMRSEERLSAIRDENERALAVMRQCPDFRVCNGWCPHERYTSLRHDAAFREECCGLVLQP